MIDRLQKIRMLTEVSRAITYAASIDEVFQLTVDRVCELVGAARSLILVANDDGLLTLRASRGVDVATAQRFREPMSEALVLRLAALLDVPVERFVGVPLVVAGAVRGVLVAIRTDGVEVEEDEEWLISALADQAAIAMEKTRLDEIGEFRERLMGIVGHDLRTPLSTVLMSSQLLLQREGLGEKETALARRITSSATRAVRLIEQLVDLTRSRLGGGIPIDPRRFDLSEVCRQVIGETEVTHPERPLEVDLRGDLNGCWDRDRMSQLLGNLVGNAVLHGEPRSAIRVRLDGEGPDVLLEVANRGKPIPPETLPHIFDAFRQGRTDHPTRDQGLGLGLFIAQEVARAHGGSITVSSTEQDGTTFRVRLPRGDLR